MNEFNDRCQIEALHAFEAKRAADQQQKRRAQALAAGRDDVPRDLPHQGYPGVKPLRNHLVNLAHVLRNDRNGTVVGLVGLQVVDPVRRPDYRKRWPCFY